MEQYVLVIMYGPASWDFIALYCYLIIKPGKSLTFQFTDDTPFMSYSMLQKTVGPEKRSAENQTGGKKVDLK